MKNRTGIIYEMENGQYGLAVHREQHDAFRKIDKVYLHYFHDRLLTKPVMLGEKKVVGLKARSKLIQIGFND